MTYTDHGTFVDEYLADGSLNPDFDPATDPSLNAELFNAINAALLEGTGGGVNTGTATPTSTTCPVGQIYFLTDTAGNVISEWANFGSGPVEVIDTSNGLPINAYTGNYSPSLLDINKVIEIDAGTFTIPAQASVAWEAYTVLIVRLTGAGPITFAGDSGVTINSASGAVTLATQWTSAVLHRRGSDLWVIEGPLS